MDPIKLIIHSVAIFRIIQMWCLQFTSNHWLFWGKWGHCLILKLFIAVAFSQLQGNIYLFGSRLSINATLKHYKRNQSQWISLPHTLQAQLMKRFSQIYPWSFVRTFVAVLYALDKTYLLWFPRDNGVCIEQIMKLLVIR